MGITSLLDDPRGFVLGLLISLPGILLALSGHEAAHGYVANRCGDPTARLMGRVTLNPLKHLDPAGFLCMLFVGFGWAKPVPVNPLHYRRYRRDDLLVSIAGITANLIMCLIGFLLMMCVMFFALSRVESYTSYLQYLASDAEFARFGHQGDTLYIARIGSDSIVMSMDQLFTASSGLWVYGTQNGAYMSITDMLISPVLGTFMGYFYQMLTSFTMVNLVLATFNLIPIPPLDGYHVLNDLVLKRPLFEPQHTMRIGLGVLFALIMLGNFNPKLDFISIALTFIRRTAFDGLTGLAYQLANAAKLF